MASDLFNPFPGLRPFESHEAHLFFGRDGQSDELLRRLRRTRFLAVVGTSGSGKSSLMRAGLLPALHGGMMAKAGAAWRVAIMRPGADPIGNLAQALHATQLFPTETALSNYQAAMLRASLSRSSLGLIETCKQAPLPASESLLVVVDQFEELFRFKHEAQKTGHGDEAAAFVQLLLEATRQQEVPIYVVFTMRSDFLGDCAQFQNLPEAINDGQYLIPRMNREQRRAAIAGPVAVAQGKISDRLVNRLLNDVGDNPDQLPILQHALMRTWDYWQTNRQNGELLDLRHYEHIGGMNAALSQHADEAYNELPDESSRKIAEIIFKRLTEKGVDNREVRQPTRLAELCAVAEARENEVAAIIEHFRLVGRSFLTPPVGEALHAETLIDISHESLIRNWQRLAGWVLEEAQSAKIYVRLADTAQLHREDKADHYRGPDLQIALDWREQQQPNAIWAKRYHPEFETAMAFLQKSYETRQAEIFTQEQQQRQQLRRRRLFSAQGISFGLIILILAGVNIYATRRAAEIKAAVDEIAANRLPMALTISDLNLNALALRLTQLQYLFTSDTSLQRQQREDLIHLVDNINSNIDTYERLHAVSASRDTYSVEERQHYQDFARGWEAYQDISFASFDLLGENQTRKAFSLLNEEGSKVFNKVNSALIELVDVNRRDSYAYAERAEVTYQQVRLISNIVILINIFLSVILVVIWFRFNLVAVDKTKKNYK